MKDENFLDQILEEINICRSNPRAYIPKLQSQLQYFNKTVFARPGKEMIETQEGPQAVIECIQLLRTLKPLPPLQWSDGLASAASDHLKDIGPEGLTGHIGTDNSEPAQRIQRYGNWELVIGQSIDYGNDQAQHIVFSWLVDDGISDRAHRFNILQQSFTQAGIAFGPHLEFDAMCVICFTGQFIPHDSRVKSKSEQRKIQRELRKNPGQKVQEIKVPEKSGRRERGEDDAQKKKAQEEAQKKKAQEEAQKKKAQEEAQKKKTQEEAQKKKAQEEAQKKKAQEEAQKKKAQEDAQKKKTQEEAQKKKAAQQAAKKKAQEEARIKAQEQRDKKEAARLRALRGFDSHGLTQEEIQACKQAFDLFDQDSSGIVNPKEIEAAVRSLGNDRSDSIFRLLAGIENLGAEIEFDDFLAHVADRLGNRNSREGIQRILDLYDHDGTGTINLRNIERVAGEIGDLFSKEQYLKVIQQVTEGESELSIDDFYRLMTRKIQI